MKVTTRAVLICATLAVVIFYALSRPFVDFLVYWSAAHLFVSGANPYSLPDVFVLQKSLGFQGSIPLMMLSPPWTLAIIAPLGFAQSYVLSWIVTISLLIASVAIASKLLMDVYFRDIKISEVSDPSGYRYLFAFTFYPVLLALKFTQMAPLLLLGVAGFIYFEKKEKRGAAGLFLALTLLKPHLFLLIWLALLLRREWKVVASAVAPIAALTAISLWRYPQVFHSYRELMSSPFPSIAMSGILSGVRDLFRSRSTFWIQFIPPVFGAGWFAWYWRKHRRNWIWSDRMPFLIAASVIFAPYGFVFDQSLFMVPIIYLAAKAAEHSGKISFNLVVAYTVLNVAILAVAIASTPWCVLPGAIGISAAIALPTPRSRNCLFPRKMNPEQTMDLESVGS